jgi:peptidoglycan/xylan/chitin deacetylase (PgdA/CDA1 family)
MAAARHPASSLAGRSGRVVVLLYHSITPSGRGASISVGAFRDQLDWLVDDCDVVDFSRVADTERPDRGGRPVVAITFDDGLADNHEHALPALADRGLSATFFVTTGLIHDTAAVRDRLARLTGVDSHEATGMSWSQLRELQGEGMHIGAHTVTHPNLAVVPADVARNEIERSKQEIEDRLGEPVEAFAYPFGKLKHHVTSETIRLVRQAGFLRAALVHFRGVPDGVDPFRIPRFSVGSEARGDLERMVRGGDDGLGLWQELAPRLLTHAVSRDRSHRAEQSLILNSSES